MMYRALLHWRLHHMLVREARHLIAPLGRVISKLQCGYWDGGTRVKKLRGFARPVYEARLDDGARAVFTVAQSACIEPPHGLAPHILLWDVRTHDRVNHVRRLNFSPESAFVDFPVEEEYETTQPAESPAQDDEIREAVRWLSLEPEWVVDDASWQTLFDERLPGFELKLTREQYSILHARGPVLVSGAAGSGKSTISVHWLAGHFAPPAIPRALYITYSAALLEHMQEWLAQLLRARGMTPVPPPDLMTFPDLYAVLSGARAAPPVRFERFAAWYTALARRADAALAWEEVRGIIKGACLDTQRAMLSREEYEELGRKRAPLFCSERPRLFQVARKYQEWLRAEHLHDDIDMARCALAALRAQPALRYDVLVCDEVQDLTEIEVSLMLELCADPLCSGLMVTGDPQQIVNPSGFRWSEVRSLWRARMTLCVRPPPEVARLTQNFRSARGVVLLANALLAVQRARTGRCDDDTAEEAHTHGPAPVLIAATREEALNGLRNIGPRVAIITPDEQSAAALQAELQTTRIFDVPGAKGLEFESVILWGMFSHEAAMWRELLAESTSLRASAAARRVVRQCYVGVTRVRRWLAVWDDEPARELWRAPALRAVLEQDSAAALQRFGAEAASPQEWEEQAEYYLVRSRYRQAEECYRRAGNLDAARRAEAEALAAAGEALRAAELFAELGGHDRAIELYTAAHAEDRAAVLCEQLGREQQARALRLAAWERAGNWRAVADARAAQQEWQAAAEAYERAGCHGRAQECRLEQYLAAEAWCDAAKICARFGQRERAAELYARGGDAAGAAAMRAALEGSLQSAMAPERTLVERAQRFEQRGDLTRAIKTLAQCRQEANRSKLLALRAEVAGEYLEAARAHFKCGAWDAVARVAKKHFDFSVRTDTHDYAASDELAQLSLRAEVQSNIDCDNYSGALLQLQRQRNILPRHEEYATQALLEEKLGRPVAALRSLLKGNLYTQARDFAHRVPNTTRMLQMIESHEAEHAGRLEEAAQLWLAAGYANDAKRCRQRLARQVQMADARPCLTPAEARRATMINWILEHPLCTRAEISAGVGVSMPALVNDWGIIGAHAKIATGKYDRRCYYAARVWCEAQHIRINQRGEMNRQELSAALQRGARPVQPAPPHSSPAPDNPSQPELFV